MCNLRRHSHISPFTLIKRHPKKCSGVGSENGVLVMRNFRQCGFYFKCLDAEMKYDSKITLHQHPMRARMMFDFY
jgi:hypothetical protein